jgi:hypothetical protein
VPSGLKRLILWDYERGVWQYDVMCAIILIFLAFAPRAWFRDQPRIPHASQISEGVFWMERDLVESVPETEQQRLDRLGKVLSARTGKKLTLSRVEPIVDSEKETKGYMAFSRP